MLLIRTCARTGNAAAADKWKSKMQLEGYAVDEDAHTALLKQHEDVVLRSPEPTSPSRGGYKSV